MRGAKLTLFVVMGFSLGLPMCGSDDSKKTHGEQSAGEGGEPMLPGAAGSSSSAGAPGAAGEPASPAGGQAAAGGAPGSGGMSTSTGGEPLTSAGTGSGGEAQFCAVDDESCCAPGESSCDNWPSPCGESMESFSCCEAGVRENCSVQYANGNYRVVYGKSECSCGGGECSCECVKAEPCGYNYVDCNDATWSDLCVLGNSPTCCDPFNGIRRKCTFSGEKQFTSEVIIDECTGEGHGDGTCTECLNLGDSACDEDFFSSCGGEGTDYCSNLTVGYRLSCDSGTTNVECTCDPSLAPPDK